MSKTDRMIYVVFGPSGCGKTSLISMLILEYPDKYQFSVSHTTRKPREGEVNGREYYFVNEEEFVNMKERGEFIESTRYANHLYGTSVRTISEGMKAEKSLILDIDIRGVKSFRKLEEENRLPVDCGISYIFIKTLNLDILEERLKLRGKNTADDIANRMLTAKEEVSWADSEDTFNYKIINDNLEKAYKLFKEAFESDGDK